MTSSGSNAAWLKQSIVDQNTGATPTFSYPSTAMAGWLCTPQLQNLGPNCTTATPAAGRCPNNSSPQGQLFYVNITGTNSPPVYNVYSVDGCLGPEGAPLGTVSALTNQYGYAPEGESAIENDMAGNTTSSIPAQCVHRAH